MGKRGRRRGAATPAAPEAEHRDDEGNVLVLRGAMSAATRREYARVRARSAHPPAQTAEDAWQRAVEFLFERLAVRWEIAGAEPLTGQKELLGRFRFASPQERAWIRSALRAHVAEHFPELDAP